MHSTCRKQSDANEQRKANLQIEQKKIKVKLVQTFYTAISNLNHNTILFILFRVCWLWRGYSQWPVLVSTGETVAFVVFYMYKMWLLAGWRIHGQVSSIKIPSLPLILHVVLPCYFPPQFLTQIEKKGHCSAKILDISPTCFFREILINVTL